MRKAFIFLIFTILFSSKGLLEDYWYLKISPSLKTYKLIFLTQIKRVYSPCECITIYKLNSNLIKIEIHDYNKALHKWIFVWNKGGNLRKIQILEGLNSNIPPKFLLFYTKKIRTSKKIADNLWRIFSKEKKRHILYIYDYSSVENYRKLLRYQQKQKVSRFKHTILFWEKGYIEDENILYNIENFLAFEKNREKQKKISSKTICKTKILDKNGIFYRKKNTVILFYSSLCGKCQEINYLVKNLKKKYSYINFIHYDTGQDVKNVKLLLKYMEVYGIKGNFSAVAFIGKTALCGREEVLKNLEQKLHSSPFWTPIILKGKCNFNITFFTTFMAALVDSINPCAFVTIIFLLSLLEGRWEERDIFKVVIFFSLGIFLCYLVIGIALYKIVSSILPYTQHLIEGVSIILCVLMIALNIIDIIFIIRDRIPIGGVPSNLRLKMNLIMRKAIERRFIFLWIFVSGVVVSLMEGICTGQIYLPTILFIIQQSRLPIEAYLLLAFYCFVFVLPILVIGFVYSLLNKKIMKMNKLYKVGIKVCNIFVFILILYFILKG